MERVSKQDFALRFELPKDSPEYKLLADTAWMGGPLVAVPFYLGALIRKNLFRESDRDIEQQLVRYFSEFTSHEGASLLRGINGWSLAAEILRFRFERQSPEYVSGLRGRRRVRQIEAVERYLTNPTVTWPNLAADLRSTEKQLGRNSLLNQARSLEQRRRAAAGRVAGA